ncbi:MAG: hypothetical protein JXA00_05480, partial [Candidatus Thermoplasmatota archaeon]|nr:hypothetical protein [Candidatus Thermoplasmatota archaeon]
MTQAYKKHLLKMLLFLVVCSLAVSVVAELSQRTTQDACDIQTTVTSEDVKHPTLRLDPWDVPLVVTSAAGGLDTAAFGAAANATDDFDTFWDEPEPPQPPFSPVVQAWFFHPGSVVCAQNVSFQGFTDALTWELCLAVDITNVSTTSLVSLSWQATDIAAIPSEYYVQLCNDTTILNMRTQTSMTLLAVTDVYTYSLRVWKDVSPPAITMVSATPSSQVIDGAVNITANVTDYSGVDTVTVLVISPDLVVQNQSMTHLTPGDLYSYNTTYHDVGVYQYHIWAKDTWGNAVDSAVAFFEIVNTPPVMASVRITPDPAYDDDDLQGYANATDADDHPVIYEWTWYRNDTEACSGVADNYNISFVGHRYDTGDGYFVWNDGTYTYLANSWGG